MATDERELLLHLIAAELDKPSIYMGGPSQRSRRKANSILGIVDKWLEARVEAAEQRVRELELDYEGLRLVGVEALDERDRAETKLTAAVEALKDALGLIDRMADESQCVLHDEIEAEEERLQRALSEIEQGDTK